LSLWLAYADAYAISYGNTILNGDAECNTVSDAKCNTESFADPLGDAKRNPNPISYPDCNPDT
jgi:hypothetical protein